MANKKLKNTEQPIESAILVGLDIKSQTDLLNTEESLDELELLSETAGIKVVGKLKQRLNSPNPATYIGAGKVEDLNILVNNLSASLIIIDGELSPRHYRELEKTFSQKIRVIDRTTLILDIFAQHASTNEGKLQVELAQYEYLYPRLTRAWSHLARQAGGGGGRAGGVGGVGLRGPGETQLEVDRRRIRSRISRLKDDIEKVREHRERYRNQRRKSQMPVAALVGYTNAGKSTLLNALTNSDVYVANKLFATLDPTTRRLILPGGNNILITDTVGFIQKLPTHLIAAFRATLEEIATADILLHIVDASNRNVHQQIQSVLDTLREIDAGDVPMLYILNKWDKVPGNSLKSLDLNFQQVDKVKISALKKTGLKKLLITLEEHLFKNFESIEVKIPYKNGLLISRFHEYGKIQKIEHGIVSVYIKGRIPFRLLNEFEHYEVN